MAIKHYNEPPYYDDFDQSKNYMRVLFRPGYAVQARELTQLQTAIQAQIDRFGSWAFKEGSPVIGGESSLDTRYTYVKLYSDFTYVGSTITGVANNGDTFVPDNYASEFLGTTITGQTTGITATVVEIVQATDRNPLTLYVKYTSSGDGFETQAFAPGEYFLSDADTPRLGQVKKLKTVDTTNGDNAPTGYGTRYSITEGAFFVAGNFVYTPSQSIIISRYTTNPSARVVFKVTESIVTSAEDSTLTDNALGSPNETAPGAHRYQVALDLQVQPPSLNDRDENNIIQLMIIDQGRKREEARVQLNEIGKTLAQRTYEESGNYTVRPFQINVREYLSENGNGGLYTWEQIKDADTTGTIVTQAQAEAYGRNKIAVGLEPSVAYVNGYRIESINTKYVEVDRARDEAYVNAAATLANLGNYITVDNASGLPNITTFSTIELKDGGTQIGTARARGFEYVSGSGASAIYKLYLFDVVMNSGEVFANVDNLYQAGTVPFSADVVSNTIVDAGNNSLIFALPVGAVQTLRSQDGTIDILYNTVRKHTATVTGGTVTLNTTYVNEKFTSTSGWTMCLTSGSSAGAIISPGTPTLGVGGASIVWSGLSAYNGLTVALIGPSLQNLREKIKRVQRNQNIAITSPDTINLLGITDLLKVSGIYMSADLSTPATTSDINVTDRYIVDGGQRDNFYDVASIRLKSTAPAATGRLLVVCDYFIHTAGDYFSVDSYVDVSYSEIPDYQSSKGTIQLHDALDFRPTKDTTATVGSGGIVPSNFDTANGASLVNMIQPNTLILADIQYYLPRIDKIWVDSKGVFGVTKGISAINPKAPDNPKDSMVLYTIGLNAYTTTSADVNPTLIDNKRYTMRDIGKLEKRISKLEYYTSLSLLEQNANSAQLFDVSGYSRYKNGFVVDGFVGSNIGAVSNPDYRASTEKSTGTLRPMFFEENVRLLWNPAASSGYRRSGSLVTLDYYQADNFITQPYASRSEFVNPYIVFNWAGKLEISPKSDEWKDTVRAPDVVVDQTGVYDAFIGMQDSSNSIGTVWNEWQTNWAGVTVSSEESAAFNDVSATAQGFQTINTATTRVVQSAQTRTGLIATVVPDTITSVVGEKVVEINFVPFIRSRKIYFRATQLKPNTRVYPFFDGVDVSAWCKTEDYFINYADRTDVTQYTGVTAGSITSSPLITDASGTLIGSFIIPNNSSLNFKTGTRIFRLVDSNINTARPAKITTWADAAYTAQGTVQSIANQVISTAVPRIEYTETSEDDIITDEPSSVVPSNQYRPPPVSPVVDTRNWWQINGFPDSYWRPDGKVVPTEDLVVSNSDVLTEPSVQPEPDRVPINDTNEDLIVPPVEETPAVIITDNQDVTQPEWTWEPVESFEDFSPPFFQDPVAQTFSVDLKGGAFITSIDLYFHEKDENIPVTVQLRTVVNGTPTRTILPFGEAILYPEFINVSEDAKAPTTFVFPSPVHLLDGVEYAFVILSNSDKVKVWTSQVGEYDVTNPTYRITTQPYNGVFFASSNASTWTPDQTKDIKFGIRRAVFTSAPATLVFNEANTGVVTLENNAIETTSGSKIIRVYQKNHGFFAGSFVTLSGAVATSGSAINGIPLTSINRTCTIATVEPNSYTINTNSAANGGNATNASATGRAGGSEIIATRNLLFDVMHPIVSQVQLTDTHIAWQARTTSGQSFAGSETPYIVSSLFDITPNENKFMARPQVVTSPGITGNAYFLSTGSGDKSFTLQASISTDRNNLSPVIDLDRISLVTVANLIDNPGATASTGVNEVHNFVDEIEGIGGSALAKYITRRVDLNDPAQAIQIYLDVNVPSSSSVEVYYKVLPKGTDTNFDTLDWTLVNPSTTLPISDSVGSYSEVQYQVSEADLGSVEFTAFSVKIVMTSTNSSAVPTCRNLRAIAIT